MTTKFEIDDEDKNSVFILRKGASVPPHALSGSPFRLARSFTPRPKDWRVCDLLSTGCFAMNSVDLHYDIPAKYSITYLLFESFFLIAL
jgi:hypothetical protein